MTKTTATPVNTTTSATSGNDTSVASGLLVDHSTLRIPRIVKMKRNNGKIIRNANLYVGNNCFAGGWTLQIKILQSVFRTEE
jgi:hypothetical protein